MKISRSGTYSAVEARMRSELRTKASVNDGIFSDEVDGDVRLVEYQPGNGTRYVFILTSLEDKETAARMTGHGGRPVLVYCHNYRRGFITQHAGKDPVHYNQVRKEFGCSIIDAVVLAELLGELLDRPCVSVDGYLRERTGTAG